MKPARFMSLVCWGLLLSAAFCHLTAALSHAGQSSSETRTVRRSSSRAARVNNTEANKDKITWTVQGFGATHDDAYEQAVKEAHAQVLKFLEGRGFTMGWQPSPEYIRDHLITGKPREEKLDDTEELVNIGANTKVALTIELTEREYRKMQQQDRHFRAGLRMGNVGKFLAVLVVGLSVIGGYLRLEEASKGYATLWLRLGVVGLLAVLGAGLFVVS